MKNNKIYIILFIILYVFVALVSGIHGFAFFGLANTPLLAIMLAIAFEIGQAAVLFSILTDGSQRKKVMPWFLMGILTLVQIMGNVYNSYKYLITNAEANLRFFKEPIFIWTEIPDAQANVILSYVQGAILPLVALLLTSMVAGFLNKKDDITEEIEYIEEEPEGEEVGDIDDTEEIPEDEVKEDDIKEIDNEPKEKQIKEEPKITIDEETNEVNTHMNQTPSHKDYYIPPKIEVEEKPIEEPEKIEELPINKEKLPYEVPITNVSEPEEVKEQPKSHFINL